MYSSLAIISCHWHQVLAIFAQIKACMANLTQNTARPRQSSHNTRHRATALAGKHCCYKRSYWEEKMIKQLLIVVFLLLGASAAPVLAADSHLRREKDTRRVGTRVYHEFPRDGWYEGTITANDNNQITITWSDDSHDIDKFSNEEIDEMIKNHQTMIVHESWPIGTKIYYEFSDGWYEGNIIDFDAGGYVVKWLSDDPNDIDYIRDDDLVDQMVENYLKIKQSNGMKQGATFAIVGLILIVTFLVSGSLQSRVDTPRSKTSRWHFQRQFKLGATRHVRHMTQTPFLLHHHAS